MNADAEKWIRDHCDNPEMDTARLAMEWAYRDAIKVAESVLNDAYRDQNSVVWAIEERLK